VVQAGYLLAGGHVEIEIIKTPSDTVINTATRTRVKTQ
jgi:hypothetical protein